MFRKLLATEAGKGELELAAAAALGTVGFGMRRLRGGSLA